jgi:hypothetical protein
MQVPPRHLPKMLSNCTCRTTNTATAKCVRRGVIAGQFGVAPHMVGRKAFGNQINREDSDSENLGSNPCFPATEIKISKQVLSLAAKRRARAGTMAPMKRRRTGPAPLLMVADAARSAPSYAHMLLSASTISELSTCLLTSNDFGIIFNSASESILLCKAFTFTMPCGSW